MQDSSAGLERSLRAGDYVILSTGAIATARQAYPKGYCGVVEMLLDGAEVSDEAGSLKLPEEHTTLTQSGPDVVALDEDAAGEVRGPSLRMED